MREYIRSPTRRLKLAASSLRHWLRRIMAHVAVVAVALFILWLYVHNTSFYERSVVSGLFGFTTFLVVSFTVCYYSFKGLRWLKRHLLWRVRRRLMITYLFVGLTPILLLALLGFIFAFSSFNRTMSRVVTAQMDATQKEALANVRNLAEAFGRWPPNARDGTIQTWLDERTMSLQPSLPGARLALWRSASGEDARMLGHHAAAQFVSIPSDERTRGMGDDTTPVGAPLPEWLRERAEWSGLAYMPAPVDSKEAFGAPSIRAVVRVRSNGQALALLLTVPISRALVQHFYDNTGIKLHPFFIDPARHNITVNGKNKPLTNSESAEQQIEIKITKDQFGDPISWQSYPVPLPVTEWSNGKQTQLLAFWLRWSWDQLLGGALISKEGQAWQSALLIICSFFLVLEILALLTAAWMTRAVTSTVHRLYGATQNIKRGDFSHRVRVSSRDQLGELAEAFNDMSANIESLLHERVEHERLEREVEIAAEVQAQLFPRHVPRLETAEIIGECRAARVVAGDYYDYIKITPGFVALALGDVSGKGISASLVMSNLQAALRAQVTIITERLRNAKRTVAATAGNYQGLALPCGVTGMDDSCAVENIASSINEQLFRSTDSNRFATLFLALYDDRTRQLRYTNAGHNAAILVRIDGSVERLTTGGIIIGAFDRARYEEARVTLEVGDLVLIFSDGISEAQCTSGEEYGEERLMQFALEHRHFSADELRHAIFEEIDNWSEMKERGDDQTLVILKAHVKSEE